MTLTIASKPPRTLTWSAEPVVHVLVVCAIIASQIIFTEAHAPSADATWHYRLGRDILNGQPIYWFGVDANRFFPDLIFTLIGLIVSGGARYTTWLYYYYSIQFLAAYLALCGLAVALYDETSKRLAFSALGIAALLLVTLASPFWCGWFLEPGGHGTGLSACIGLLALALWMNKTRDLNWVALGAFAVSAALLIASNRFMLVGFFLPLIFAIAVGAGARRFLGSEAETGREQSLWQDRLLILIACTVIAAAAGLVLWQVLNTVSWYRMTAGGSFPDVPNISNLGTWVTARIEKELSDLARDDGETHDIRPAVAFLFAIVPVAIVDAVRIAGTRTRSRLDENRLMFSAFTAASVLGGLFFVFVIAVESGPYHYRYLTIPFGLALVYAGSFLVPVSYRLGRLQGLALVALLVAILGVATYRLDERQGQILSNRALQSGVGALEAALRKHSSAPIMRGFAEYWEAHDLTLRSDQVHMVNVEVDRLRFGLYNNNATELCHNDFFYVLWNARENQPKREAIISSLGEPAETEPVNLGRYTDVQIFYYDPKVLQAKLVEPSLEAVRRLYPAFKCP
jgi:MFS family permease